MLQVEADPERFSNGMIMVTGCIAQDLILIRQAKRIQKLCPQESLALYDGSDSAFIIVRNVVRSDQ